MKRPNTPLVLGVLTLAVLAALVVGPVLITFPYAAARAVASSFGRTQPAGRFPS